MSHSTPPQRKAIGDKPKPCHSPYCECEEGKCTHPGFYDDRGNCPCSYCGIRCGSACAEIGL